MTENTLDKKIKFYTEYCSGCGICGSEKGIHFEEKNGFFYPKIINEDQTQFCSKICPVNGINYNKRQETNLWGPSYEIYKGWATDNEIRFQAASGGVLTALACFLIESGKCDEIIQIGSSKSNPLELQLQTNSTRNQILACSSSRYITGLTFNNLLNLIDYEKKYAVIGKPCDIEALLNYMEYDHELKRCIKYTMTFFCAGAPSRNATVKLANRMGMHKENIEKVRYRGNGWPGKTTVTDTEGYEQKMDYIDAWNKILGRDIRKMCKFCVNGTGMFADISCGDLWHLDKDNNPKFSEGDGRNIVFARNAVGYILLQQAAANGYLYLEPYDNIKDLKYVQPNHFIMQTTMRGKLLGLRLSNNGELMPQYNKKILSKVSKGNVSKIKIFRTALGTIKRQKKGTL